MIEAMRCATCVFWRKITDESGECHRRSPAYRSPKDEWSGVHRTESAWPPTACYDGCGDHMTEAEYNFIRAVGNRP